MIVINFFDNKIQVDGEHDVHSGREAFHSIANFLEQVGMGDVSERLREAAQGQAPIPEGKG